MTEVMNFEYAGTAYAGFTVAAALAQGVPQAVVDKALAACRREKIKTECRRRIYAIASAEAQINISGAATVANTKTSSQRSTEETALLATYALSLRWIMDMRATVETLSADTEADYLIDASWPVCPAEVIALAGQF